MTDIDLWHPAMVKLGRSQALGSGPHPSPLVLDEDLLARVDAFAIATPSRETASIQQLATYLATKYADDQVAQIRALFCWIASNIRYDWPAYLSGKLPKQDAEHVLQSRVSVCEGYSNLFLALCNCVGIKAYKIIGGAMGVGLEAGDPAVNLDAHAWNAVLVRGEYRFIESTWASGTVSNGKFITHYNPTPYFLVSPKQFIYSHIPKDDPSQQFLSTPLTHKEWIELPHIGPAFRINGMRLVRASGHDTQIQTHGNALLSFLDIRDDYLEIVIEVETVNFRKTGGTILTHLTRGELAPLSTTAKSLVWIDSTHHKTTIHDKGGLATSLLDYCHPHPVHSTVKSVHTFFTYLPRGEFVCRIMASLSQELAGTCFPALTFRVHNTGSGTRGPPPKLYSGSGVRPIAPVEDTLKVGSTVLFKAQVDEDFNGSDVIVMSPDKQITKMVLEDSFRRFWTTKVDINVAGEWRVGMQTGLKLSFGAGYKAV
ncbi:hypothetical protein HK100_007604 [Physocladia obscura]|uniref:Transglutaminase-like domain-containing protein n=1 Tax=Physocladia obscura TaxID=109957 RepID=A0AAD5TF99_9FUNG|nr:hypothetical protein HK100_007604 [Physocladia obscura]